MVSVSEVSAVEAGDPAPSWRGTDLNGQTLVFPDAESGRLTVLVFWATWCPYCEAFMPHLAGIERDYMARGARVLAVNAKENEDGDPRAYLQRKGYAFTTVLDGDAIAEDYGVKYIPGLLIVDESSGTVVWRRAWTDLPAGQEVAELWDGQVREILDRELSAR
jgi:thiol-disulfide isomerase/thioredoxin